MGGLTDTLFSKKTFFNEGSLEPLLQQLVMSKLVLFSLRKTASNNSFDAGTFLERNVLQKQVFFRQRGSLVLKKKHRMFELCYNSRQSFFFSYACGAGDAVERALTPSPPVVGEVMSGHRCCREQESAEATCSCHTRWCRGWWAAVLMTKGKLLSQQMPRRTQLPPPPPRPRLPMLLLPQQRLFYPEFWHGPWHAVFSRLIGRTFDRRYHK